MKTINNVDINNKRVIVRLDLNVPIKNNKILDDTRIKKSLKTLNYIIERASKVIILSHLGRIKTDEDKKNNSLKLVCDYLSTLINKKISFYDYTNDEVLDDDLIMFENTRYFDLDNKKESNNDLELAKYFSSFGDIFINDAFGTCHRCNASNVGISNFIPSYNGFLVEEEIENLDRLLNNPERPYVVIMGGKKVSDKIKVIENIIKKCDKLIIGGAMAYTFLKAKGYEIGSSFYEEEYLDFSKNILDKYNDKIVLIKDNYNQDKELIKIEEMKKEDIGYDIGPDTIELYKSELKNSKTVFFNGPMGLFEEEYEYGTKELCNILNNINAFVLVGGGDTVNAVNKYVPNNSFNISTGGGASLEYLEGKKLPGVFYEEEV